MNCEVTVRIPFKALTHGERRHAAFKKGREFASSASLTHQGSRFDDLRGILTERYFGDLDAATLFVRHVHEHLSAQLALHDRDDGTTGEFSVEVKITGYLRRRA